MNFYTKYNRPTSKRQIDYEPSRTEQSGIVPLKDQVKRMQIAGARLADYRKAVYHANPDRNGNVPDIPDDFVNLDDPGLDIAEVSSMANSLAARLSNEAARIKSEGIEEVSKGGLPPTVPESEPIPKEANQ